MLSYPLNDSGIGADGRNRTDKPKREILSLLCLPISPHPQELYYTSTNLARQVTVHYHATTSNILRMSFLSPFKLVEDQGIEPCDPLS